MRGKNCVAIACDLRLGLQALTVSNNNPKIFSYSPSVYLGLTGLQTDVSSVHDLLRYKVNLYRLREERSIGPRTLASLVSSSLYEKRFGPWFVGPVVAGLEEKTGEPFICGFDSIGCIDFAKVRAERRDDLEIIGLIEVACRTSSYREQRQISCSACARACGSLTW